MMSISHPDPDMPDHGMETLSALFDGELRGDAARFAISRLGHDAQWRQACGNWQLLGDALRGQAGVAAPAGFAARVAAALVAEPVPDIAAGNAAPAATSLPLAGVPAARMPVSGMPRRKWIGGAALAATVAMVAMFVARPFSQDAATVPGSTMPAPTELVVAPASSSTDATSPAPAPATAIQAGAVGLAVADLPRRALERRSRGQSQRAALRAVKRQAVTSAVAVNGQSQHSTSYPSVASPFRPPHADVIARPWPRAVLPATSSSGAFTASYGGGSANSPSFYPFEPGLPNASDADPTTLNADGPQP